MIIHTCCLVILLVIDHYGVCMHAGGHSLVAFQSYETGLPAANVCVCVCVCESPKI